MRLYSNFTEMTMSIALQLLIEDSDLENDEYEVIQLAENDFRVVSKNNDPFVAFDFNVRIYIDPVICAITYDIYKSLMGDVIQYTITDVKYDRVA